MLRTVYSGFFVVWLEFRRLSYTPEDILTAWIRRPGVEVVLQKHSTDVGLLERINEVFPF